MKNKFLCVIFSETEIDFESREDEIIKTNISATVGLVVVFEGR